MFCLFLCSPPAALTPPSLESVAYEFNGKGGVITFNYPDDKKPDTKVGSRIVHSRAQWGDSILF